MVSFLANFFTSFVLGLLTPLTALCVLPLYPGFLVFLSSKLEEKSKKKVRPIVLGLVVTAGVLLFMILLGLIFTTVFQVSLTQVIQIISPIAFILLGIIALLLIFNVDIGRFFPKVHAPIVDNPLWSAFIFGFFFGAIVIPCNPAFIAAFFARATLLSTNFIPNMLNFLSFGVGIAFPLLVFSAVSEKATKTIISFLAKYKRAINLIAGIIMLGVALYYLIYVFRIFG